MERRTVRRTPYSLLAIIFLAACAGDSVDSVTLPTFPPNNFSLTSPTRCDSCVPPSISLEWGPANDNSGSGIKGYWIYIDGVKFAFTSDTDATPTVHYTLISSGVVDTTQQHLYQVSAVDNANNESALFGFLRT